MKTQENKADLDPFLCVCSSCERFWKDNFGECASLFTKSDKLRTTNTCIMQKDREAKDNSQNPPLIRTGDRVLAKGGFKGTVKFIGPLNDDAISPPTYVGIQADDNVGSTHNGLYKGKRYFHCPPGHGLIVKYNQVMKIAPAEKKPAVKGNSMFPSYQEIKASRKERNEKDPSWNIGPPYNKPITQDPLDKSDKSDMAVKDAKRKENQRRKQAVQASRQETNIPFLENQPEKNISKWKHKFGGDERAEHMSKTLQMLREAYREGLQYQKQEEAGTQSDKDEDADDEDDSVRGDHEGHERKKTVRIGGKPRRYVYSPDI